MAGQAGWIGSAWREPNNWTGAAGGACLPMPRDDSLTPRDLAGKLDVLAGEV